MRGDLLAIVLALGCASAAQARPDDASPERVVASLRFMTSNQAEFEMRVMEPPDYRLTLKVDCIRKCAAPVHFETPEDLPPQELVWLDGDDLLYTLRETGCCYQVLVLHVTSGGVTTALDVGSRGRPELRAHGDPIIVTYMRPQDRAGRDLSMTLRPIRWVYRDGRFTSTALARRLWPPGRPAAAAAAPGRR
jgi:hypothetical protein